MTPDIPTALSRRETSLLQSVCRGRTVVEAGALLGYSTVIIGRVASKVTSVDRHSGYTGPTYRTYRNNLLRFGVSHKTTVIVDDVRYTKYHLQAEVAFLDLDGTSSTTFLALRKVHAPLVLIHDVTRSNCKGVEVAIRLHGLIPIAHIDTLGVFSRR